MKTINKIDKCHFLLSKEFYKLTEHQQEEEYNAHFTEFLHSLSANHLSDDITDYLTANLYDIEEAEEITEEARDNGFFNKECIYYYNAINYLKEKDASLNDSIEIAKEYGYTLENINSEILASLLMSREEEENYYNNNVEEEMQNFIDNYRPIKTNSNG